MKRFRVWYEEIKAEIVFADTAWEARNAYARKHHVPVENVQSTEKR